MLQGRSGLNRSIEGDLVAIELLPEDQWSSPSEVVLEDDETKAETTVDEALDEEKILQQALKKKNKKPTGKVVGIIRRKWRQYCGILQQKQNEGSVYQLFIPAEKKIPKIRIETRQADILRTQKIIVAIDSWPRHSRYPQVRQ